MPGVGSKGGFFKDFFSSFKNTEKELVEKLVATGEEIGRNINQLRTERDNLITQINDAINNLQDQINDLEECIACLQSQQPGIQSQIDDLEERIGCLELQPPVVLQIAVVGLGINQQIMSTDHSGSL